MSLQKIAQAFEVNNETEMSSLKAIKLKIADVDVEDYCKFIKYIRTRVNIRSWNCAELLEVFKQLKDRDLEIIDYAFRFCTDSRDFAYLLKGLILFNDRRHLIERFKELGDLPTLLNSCSSLSDEEIQARLTETARFRQGQISRYELASILCAQLPVPVADLHSLNTDILSLMNADSFMFGNGPVSCIQMLTREMKALVPSQRVYYLELINNSKITTAKHRTMESLLKIGGGHERVQKIYDIAMETQHTSNGYQFAGVIDALNTLSDKCDVQGLVDTARLFTSDLTADILYCISRIPEDKQAFYLEQIQRLFYPGCYRNLIISAFAEYVSDDGCIINHVSDDDDIRNAVDWTIQFRPDDYASIYPSILAIKMEHREEIMGHVKGMGLIGEPLARTIGVLSKAPIEGLTAKLARFMSIYKPEYDMYSEVLRSAIRLPLSTEITDQLIARFVAEPYGYYSGVDDGFYMFAVNSSGKKTEYINSELQTRISPYITTRDVIWHHMKHTLKEIEEMAPEDIYDNSHITRYIRIAPYEVLHPLESQLGR